MLLKIPIVCLQMDVSMIGSVECMMKSTKEWTFATMTSLVLSQEIALCLHGSLEWDAHPMLMQTKVLPSLTTNNSFAALSTVEAMLEPTGGNVGDLTVVVIGSTVMVGQLAVCELLQHFPNMNLVGSELSGFSPLVDLVAKVLLELSFGDDMNKIGTNLFSLLAVPAHAKLAEPFCLVEGNHVNIHRGLKEDKGACLLKMSQSSAEQFDSNQ